jgi:hypothetical protein
LTSEIFYERVSLIDYISNWVGAYLVRDKLSSFPVPNGYEVDARAGSDIISAHAEIKNIKAPTSIPQGK